MRKGTSGSWISRWMSYVIQRLYKLSGFTAAAINIIFFFHSAIAPSLMAWFDIITTEKLSDSSSNEHAGFRHGHTRRHELLSTWKELPFSTIPIWVHESLTWLTCHPGQRPQLWWSISASSLYHTNRCGLGRETALSIEKERLKYRGPF